MALGRLDCVGNAYRLPTCIASDTVCCVYVCLWHMSAFSVCSVPCFLGMLLVYVAILGCLLLCFCRHSLVVNSTNCTNYVLLQLTNSVLFTVVKMWVF